MSTFLCTDKHINTIVVWALENGFVSADEIVQLAHDLKACNAYAADYRFVRSYDITQPRVNGRRRYASTLRQLIKIAASAPPITHHQAYTMLASLHYQCAEGDTLSTHPAAPKLIELGAKALQLFGGDKHDMARGYWDYGREPLPSPAKPTVQSRELQSA